MLVSELSTQGVISNVQGHALLQSFQAGSKSIESALDQYESSRNMQSLVELLKEMATDEQ